MNLVYEIRNISVVRMSGFLIKFRSSVKMENVLKYLWGPHKTHAFPKNMCYDIIKLYFDMSYDY